MFYVQVAVFCDEAVSSSIPFALPLLCEKSGAILLVLVDLTAGIRQSDEILIDFEKFVKILYRLHC